MGRSETRGKARDRSDPGPASSAAGRAESGAASSAAGRSESGSTSLEVVMLVPVLMLLALFVLWAGRGGRAALLVDLAAEEAATAAALACKDGGTADEAACEDLVADVLSARPGLDFLCIGGARPNGTEGLVESSFIRFGEDRVGGDPPKATGVGLFGVQFLCETDGAVAPMRGVFPTVAFHGQATEVAIQQGPPKIEIHDAIACENADPNTCGDRSLDGGTLKFRLTLDAPAPDDVPLPFTIIDGTYADQRATHPDDFTGLLTDVAVIPENAVEHWIEVLVADDVLHEADETIEVELGESPWVDPDDPDLGRVFEIEDGIATGTILDDDNPPTVRVTDASVQEVTGGRLGFRVIVNDPIGRDMTVNYGARPGPGAAPAHTDPQVTQCPSPNPLSPNPDGPIDYIEENWSRELRPGDSLTLYAFVDVCPDLVGEPDETLELFAELESESASGTGTIYDDEARLTVQDARACESLDPNDCGQSDLDGGEVSFDVVLRRGFGQISHPAVTVDYVVLPNEPPPGMDAVPGGVTGVTDRCNSDQPLDGVLQDPFYYDYQPVSDSVPIPAGTGPTTETITVRLNDDDLDESDETFRLQLCLPNLDAYMDVDDRWAVGTIVDDDEPPAVTVHDAVANEPPTDDPNDATALSFLVELGSHSGRDVEIVYYIDHEECYDPGDPNVGPVPPDVLNLNATPRDDFDEPLGPRGPLCTDPWRSVTFPAATSSDPPAPSQPIEGPIEVTVLHDTLDEGPDTEDDAERLALRLVPDNGTAVFGAATVTGDDPDSCAPSRDDDPNDPADDDTDNDCALGLIIDNDVTPAVSIFADASAGTEGGVVEFEVRLVDSGSPGDPTALTPSGAEVAVEYQIVHRDTPAADLHGGPPAGHLTASEPDLVGLEGVAGVWRGRHTFIPDDVFPNNVIHRVRVGTADDSIDELDSESFELRLVPPNLGDNWVAGVDGTGLIADDDPAPALVVIDTCTTGAGWPQAVAGPLPGTGARACASEGDGNVTFTVGLEDPTKPPGTLIESGRDVSVGFTTRDDGAVRAVDRAAGGADYGVVDTSTPDDQRTIQIRAGKRTATFDVAIFDDAINEKDERFRVDFQADPDNPGVVQLRHTAAQGAIVDDDDVTLSFADTCGQTVESLVGQTVEQVDVDACASEDDAGGTVTFTLALSQAINRSVTVEYYTSDLTRGHYGAAAGEDYAAHPKDPADQRRTLTILANARFATIEVDIDDDDVYEHDEVFTLTLALAGAQNVSLDGPVAVGAILDDEDPPRLSVADAEGAEGAEVVFTATLLKPGSSARARIGRVVTAQWTTSGASTAATADEGLDYDGATGDITFDPSATLVNARTEQTLSVATLDDAVVDAAETFEVRVKSADPGAVAPPVVADGVACVAEAAPDGTALDGCAVGAILDDSLPQVRVLDAAAAEGGLLSFTVRLVDVDDPDQALASPVPVTVDFATTADAAPGTAAATPRGNNEPCDVPEPDFEQVYSYGFDYVAASGSVTFDPADPNTAARTEKRVTVETCDDHHDEAGIETLTLELTAATNAHLAAGTAATGRIRDNDDPPVATVVDSTTDDPRHHASAREGEPVAFTVRLVNGADHGVPAPSTGPVEVPYHTFSTGAGTLNATPGAGQGDPAEADYRQVPAGADSPGAGLARFEPGVTQQQVEIETFGDSRPEPPERFQLVLDETAGASLHGHIGIGSIAECVDLGERAEVVAIRVNDLDVSEGSSLDLVRAELGVELTHAPCDEVQVSLQHHANLEKTATHPADLTTSANRIDFQFDPQVVTIAAFDVAPAVLPQVWIRGDTVDEHDEWFEVAANWAPSVSLPDGFAGDDTVARVTILDDDDPPAAAVFGPPEAVSAGTTQEFGVRLVDPVTGEVVASGKDVSVDLYTCCGTAVPGTGSDAAADYDGQHDEDSGQLLTVEFPAHEPPERTVSIDTYSRDTTEDDVADEYVKNFHMTLAAAHNADLSNDRRTALATIIVNCITGVSDPVWDPTSRDSGTLGIANEGGFPIPKFRIVNADPWFDDRLPAGLADADGRPLPVVAALESDATAVVEIIFEPAICPGDGWGFDVSSEGTIGVGDDIGEGTEVSDIVLPDGSRLPKIRDSTGEVNVSIQGDTDEHGNLTSAWDAVKPTPNFYATRGRTLLVPLHLADNSKDGPYIRYDVRQVRWLWPVNWLGSDIAASTTDFVVASIDDEGRSFSLPDPEVVEGWPVSLLERGLDGRSVHFETRPQPEGAKEGTSCSPESDYVGLDVTVPESGPGLEVETCHDHTVEPPETFLVSAILGAATDLWPEGTDDVVLEDYIAEVAIRDCIDTTLEPPASGDEFAPTLAAEDVDVTVTEGETATVRFTLGPRPFCDSTLVEVRVDDVEAEHGSDYTGIRTGYVEWPDDTVEYSIDFETLAGVDTALEETFTVGVTFCSTQCAAQRFHDRYGGLGAAVATVTIEKPECITAADVADTPVGWSASPGSWRENAGAVEVVWTLDYPLCEASAVSVGTTDIDAQRGSDFEGGGGRDPGAHDPPSRVVVPAGDTEVRVGIEMLDDSDFEGTERFRSWIRWISPAPEGWWSQGSLWQAANEILDNECVTLTAPPATQPTLGHLRCGRDGGRDGHGAVHDVATVLRGHAGRGPGSTITGPEHGSDYTGIRAGQAMWPEGDQAGQVRWPEGTNELAIEVDVEFDSVDDDGEAFEVRLHYCRLLPGTDTCAERGVDRRMALPAGRGGHGHHRECGLLQLRRPSQPQRGGPLER